MAAPKKITYPKGTSPRGVAVFPHLNKPDDKFNADKPIFKTNHRVTADDAAPLVAKIDELMDQMSKADPAVLSLLREEEAERLVKAVAAKPKSKAKAADLPYAPDVDKDSGDETGDVIFKFKMNAQYKNKAGETIKKTLPLFDAKNNPITANVWGGSVIRVSFTLMPWVNAKSEYGVKLGMEAVKVLELQSGGGARDASGYGFEEEEGYEADTLAPESNALGGTTVDGDDDF